MSNTQSRASTTTGLPTTRDVRRGSSHPNSWSVHGNDPQPDRNRTNPTILTICAPPECLCSGVAIDRRQQVTAAAPHALMRRFNSVEPLIEQIELALELLDTQSRLCTVLDYVILDCVQALLGRIAHIAPRPRHIAPSAYSSCSD